MKPPNFAPAYVSMYPALCEIARDHGYALMIHGTVTSDMDLLAVPWVDDPKTEQELVDAIALRLKLIYGEFGTGVDSKPEVKPHGRIAYNLFIGAGSRLDFGVMQVIKK